MQATPSPWPSSDIRVKLNNLALEFLDQVRKRFRHYQQELGATEWSRIYIGEISRFVSCFDPVIDGLVKAHHEYGCPEASIVRAVLSCIVAAINKPTFVENPDPECPSIPNMPATYPWQVSELFDNEEFRKVLERAISESVDRPKCFNREPLKIENLQAKTAETGGGLIASAPHLNSVRKRGRPGDPERAEAIRAAIGKFGDRWRDHFSEITTELKNQNIALGSFETFEIPFDDGESIMVKDWDDLDLSQGKVRHLILERIRKYRRPRN